MLVWKAISSMPFTILATSALEESIAAIAWFISTIVASISTIVSHPDSTTERDSSASALAFCALSAVARIMLVISSSDALVSSTEAACWLAPEESELLDMETCLAVAEVWTALRSSSTMTSVMLSMVAFQSRSICSRAFLLASLTRQE